MSPSFIRVTLRFGIASLLGVMSGTSAIAQSGVPLVTCHNPGAEGAVVDAGTRCSVIKHFSSEDTLPDERIARNLHVENGKFARSIALVIGVSKYSNSDYDLPAAHVDVDNLQKFLIDDQNFDEVIVLENSDVTVENIRYFLRTYATQRAAYYRGKVRFLVTYSGHGVPVEAVGDTDAPGGTQPSVGLALPTAVNDRDLQNIYGLNELRPLFTDLAKNTYHFLALINACYGGDIFGLAMVGGDMNDTAGRSSYGITAGPADKTVIDLGKGHGSLFFDTLIQGVESGDADSDARRVTLGLDPSPQSYNGIVRLGALDAYLSKQILKVVESGAVSASDAAGDSHHWSGPIEPETVRSEGGFFFFQHRLSAIPASEALPTSYASSQRVGNSFAPSLNQIAQPQIPDDGFGVIRASPGVRRGVDVSHFNQAIDWSHVVKADIRFAYIKATQGSVYRDPKFQANWKGAKSAGLPRGAYHTFSFCQPPLEQLANLKKAIYSDAGELPVAIDVELFQGQGSSTIVSMASEGACAASLRPEGIRRNLTIILDGLKSAFGKRPVLYANDYLLDEVLGSDFTTKLTLWRASFGVQRAPKPPWTLWQFTENEKVDGIPGRVDINVVSDAPEAAKSSR